MPATVPNRAQHQGAEGAGQAKAAVSTGYRGVAAAWRRWKPQFDIAGRAGTELIVHAARVESGMRVLDVASGAGEPALALAAAVGLSGAVVATDLVSEMLATAAELADTRGLANLSFAVADAEALPFGDEGFERVTCRTAVMHFPDPVQAVCEVRRVLKPGGRAAFTALGPFEMTSAATSTVGVLMQYLATPPRPAPGVPSPYQFARPSALAAVFCSAGFHQVEETLHMVPWPWPGPAEEYLRSLPEHAWGFGELLDALLPEQRRQAIAEMLAAIRACDDGHRLCFTAPLVLVTGTR